MNSTPILPFMLFNAVATIAAAQTESAKEVHDGFDGNKPGAIWSLERSVPGAIEMQTIVVRSGRGAAKITVHEGDLREGIDPLQSKETERDELQERVDLVNREGEAYAYSFSIFLPKDFPIVSTRLVLAQWKQYDQDKTAKVDNPIMAIRYASGEMQITLQTNREKQILFRTTEEMRGRWLDFVFHLKFTRTSEGFARAWLNGRQVASFRGVTAYTEAHGYPKNGRFYFKMGLYRDRMAAPMTAYFDEYRKRALSDVELK